MKIGGVESRRGRGGGRGEAKKDERGSREGIGGRRGGRAVCEG